MNSTGTPTSILRWIGALSIGEDSRMGFFAVDGSASELVTDLDMQALAADPEAWATQVCELADEDAASRGMTTRYQIRHTRGERGAGVHNMRRVIRTGTSDEPQIDASQSGILAQLLRTVEKQNAQIIETSRVQTASMQAMASLVSQAFTNLRTVQEANVALHLDSLQTAEAARATTGPAGDDPFSELVRAIGPHLAKEAIARLLPGAPGAAESMPEIPKLSPSSGA